jgi:hypothetical protein
MSQNIPVRPPKIVLRRIRKDLKYNPKSGITIWIHPRSTKLKPGDIAGSQSFKGTTIEFGINKQRYIVKAHHIAWYLYYGEWPTKQIDHKDVNNNNNKINNLRQASDSQNVRNRKLFKNNTSGIKGIDYRISHQKYRARIAVNGKLIHLGYFYTLIGAKRARRRAEKQYFKKFRYRHRFPHRLCAQV